MDGFLGRVRVRLFVVSLELLLTTAIALAVDYKYVGSEKIQQILLSGLHVGAEDQAHELG